MSLILFTHSHLWQILTGILTLFLVKKIILFNRLRKFRGPPGTGFTNFFHGKEVIGANCHHWYTYVNETYGPIARIAPNILITSSPEVWTHVNIKPTYKRSDWYYNAVRIEYRRDNVFSQADNHKHDERRKQMAPG